MINTKHPKRFFVLVLLVCTKRDLYAANLSHEKEIITSSCTISTNNQSIVTGSYKPVHHVHELSPEASAHMSKRHLEERKQALKDRIKIAALKTRIWMRSKMSYTKDGLAITLNNVKQAMERGWSKTKTGAQQAAQRLKTAWNKVSNKIKKEQPIAYHQQSTCHCDVEVSK